ncbi:hypothetical protein AR457_05475 [Streptomyces agglomeratus]|uniref:hypothetical protein n=1 Tax=Streptomyces agglomeratus TaxID=285458 RepID=UPI0008526CA1|nr:hypothetical protein [Streptomyces agglomeratus]OEJ36809.1 hypothetical protein BGK70_00005 [Streptomyces agglomeratus]OEJ36837.1 hypothetical protein BGK70_00190 [Streptomyces agglomeratus]OEJ41995.1 hypothetical protein BGK70_31165 [Streptomyces agglomeratus]OEJ43625.1 hypothetical protein AR457_05475 [Streptomyces agglomeratus]OEJ61856.1 hypothetical protein BGM19_31370 [Streptomyces agglomeratus]
MRTWTRAVPAAIGALALALALTGCNDLGSGKNRGGSGSQASGSGSNASDEKKTFRLGEEGPEQESDMQKSSGAKYTVTPTEVRTGTKADMDNSGLRKDKEDGPQIPVYVWSTLTHKSGPAMEVGDMDDDLVIRADSGLRTRALLVMLGAAKWPNCPEPEAEKKLSPGQSEKICTAFLIPEGQKPTAVEVTRGFHNEPLEWPVA